MERLRKDVYIYVQRLSLGLVWRELQVFSKLLYRARNQHRRDRSYQRLVKVSKDLRRYQDVSLSNYIKRLWKMLPETGSLSVDVSERVDDVSRRLVECAQFTSKLLEFIEVTYHDVDIRLKMSLFVPFNLLMISTLSRMWFCLRYHLHAISETFSLLTICLMPSQKNSSSPLSVVESLSKEHKHYLQRPVLPLSDNDNDLGTAVVRPDYTCLKVEDVITIPPPLTESLSPHLENTGHTLTEDTHLGSDSLTELPLTSIVNHKGRRKRCPNTIVGVVKIGQNIASLKIRCKKYLLTLHRRKSQRIRRIAFRLNRVKLRSMGRNPWSMGYVALKYQMNFQPLLKETGAENDASPKLYNCIKAPSFDSTPRAGPWPSLATKELQKKFCTHLSDSEPCSVSPDDIDDIFSSLI